VPDWRRARNAAGLVDPNYWAGTLQPRPTVDWYLDRVAAAVAAARAAAPGAPLSLLAHSAGGWLGRLYLLDFGIEGVDQFVSLGSPHLAPPPGVADQTRGILTWVGANAPGAHHAPAVQYVTVAGRYIRGAPLRGPGPWASRVVGAGYQQVRLARQGRGGRGRGGRGAGGAGGTEILILLFLWIGAPLF
jgi:pimeloyl-ACP methyl ester carboxylesterase